MSNISATGTTFKSERVEIIIDDDATPRVDSRIIVERLGIDHESLMRNVDKYSKEFQQLGLLRWWTGFTIC